MSVVEEFRRSFKDFEIALSGWEILDKGITVLWGPSGAGKTTILQGLLGLDDQAQVRWIYQGVDLAQIPVGERGLAVVFQEPGLFPLMTAQENILFPVNKKKHTHWQSDFDYLVTTLQLRDILKQSVRTLSGGEKQRVALARALIYRPQLVFLDEPFSALDEDRRYAARGLIKKLNQELNIPMVLVTHNREDVRELAHKVTQIEAGSLVREGTAQEFLSHLNLKPT